MLHLGPKPDLLALQAYVKQLEIDRGFTDNSVQQECLQLGEEVGELFKAVRKRERFKVDANSKIGTVDEELADILIYVCAIANRFGVDLETAFREKEEINKKRMWRVL